MVFYFKVNREENYTYKNLQHWMDIVKYQPNSDIYIVCDNEMLQSNIQKMVDYRNGKVSFLKSCTDSDELQYIVSNGVDAYWRKVAMAHLTTFLHARDNGYKNFWNIDADDTYFCLEPVRVCEILHEVEEYANVKKIDAFSLDMWRSREYGKHWSFGVTYIDNKENWLDVMKKHCKGDEWEQPENLDGFFTYLKKVTNLKIETFYFENLRFLHYSDDFFSKPISSGFFHWKKGKLRFPVLYDCLGMRELGLLKIADDVIKLDADIKDEEVQEFMIHSGSDIRSFVKHKKMYYRNKNTFNQIIHNSRVAIWGDYRYCNDFKYVFGHIFKVDFNYVFYRKDDKTEENIFRELGELSKQYDMVIACVDGSDHWKIDKANEPKVIWMEELFELLDEISAGWYDVHLPSDEYHRIPETKKLALWGLNDACKFFLNYQTNLKPDCIIDMDTSKSEKYHNIPVTTPDKVNNFEEYYVLIMCRNKYSVREYLESKGLKEKEDFKYYGYYIDQFSASQMLRITIYDVSKRKIDCYYPFYCARLETDGALSLCSCEYIPAGNILQNNTQKVWKSPAAAIIRLSMINQTYSFCQKWACQFFDLERLDSLDEPLEKSLYEKEAESEPGLIWMNNSITCNLHCEICRTGSAIDTGTQKIRSLEISKKAVPLISKSKCVFIAGNGEAFLSESYGYIWDKMEKIHHNNLRWIILSNGILMTREKIDRIIEISGSNTRIMVSVDAARKETYEMIRGGGNWEKLIDNLKYVGWRTRRNEIDLFRLNFVVQSKNVKEMGEFVKLARSLGATEVWFTAILNFGAYTQEEFKKIDVRDGEGKIKKEYQEYFENPILKSNDVKMGALLTGKDSWIDI